MKGEGEKIDSIIFDKKFDEIVPGSLRSATIDITNLINTWPDSITFDTRLRLPSGTGVSMYNSKDLNGNYTSLLTIDLAVNWTITIPISWEITDTIRTELEISKQSLKTEELEWVKKLHNPRLQIALDAFNQTNLNFALHALGAAGAYEKELMSFPESCIGTDDFEDRKGNHLFTLFDDEGLHLARRGEQTTTMIHLDERGINALLSEDDCLIRWFLIIPPGKADALLAADYLELKATGVIDGIADTDSLLYFE
jgi:hypothetical protein